jgi:SPP1 gp7 family putative phage head morphogenesis protein
MPQFLYQPVPNKAAAKFIRDKEPVVASVAAGLLPELRGLSFSITGVENMAVLKRARELIAKIPEGADWNETKKKLSETLAPWIDKDALARRAELLLRTHGFQAYSAAAYQVADRQRDVFPFWQYQSAEDGRVRPAHAALNGLVFPANSPFWHKHYPPWEYGCRCQVIPLSEEDVAEMQKEDAKKVPEARRLVEGARLALAEKNGTLLTATPNGIPQSVDVRSPTEKQGASGFYWHPGDLHPNLEFLKKTYGAEEFGKFKTWAEKTKLGGGDSASVWGWLNEKQAAAALQTEAKPLSI